MIGVFSVRRIVSEKKSPKMLGQLLERLADSQLGLCACCGVSMGNAIGIAYVDSNPENLIPENCKAVCRVCEALHNGGRLNQTEQLGVLVYLPQVNQVDLIRMAHAIKRLALDASKELIAPLVELKTGDLKLIQAPVKDYLGFDEPDALSDMLKNLKPNAYNDRERAMGPIRWWPKIDHEQFSAAIIAAKDSFATTAELKKLSL